LLQKDLGLASQHAKRRQLLLLQRQALVLLQRQALVLRGYQLASQSLD
jgi:hypothetical protein